MAQTITASVGQAGANRFADVQIVQGLLNRVPADAGGPAAALTVDGQCGAKTVSAIRAFQSRQFGASAVDGRIDPGQRSLARLNELATGKAADPANPRCFAAVHYIQGDPRWRGLKLPGGATMWGQGCAVSSVAEAMAGKSITLDGAIVNPGSLHRFLIANAGFTGNKLNWRVPAQVSGRMHFDHLLQGHDKFSAQQLREHLNTGNGVAVVNVRHGEHWVLLIGHNGGTTFYCADPGFGAQSHQHSEMSNYALYTIR